MRHLSSLLFFLICLTLATTGFGQSVIIDEDFSDGDYTSNPTWSDSESKYIVNGSNLLQLDAPASTDEAAITTPSTAAYGEWEALIQLDFNPSGSNLAKFYVISDSQNLLDNLNGYYIMIGDTEEEVSLYRQDGSGDTKIIDGTDGLIDSNPVNIRIKVTRDLNGKWELLADASGGTSFSSQGTTTDKTYARSDFIGLLSDYTSTRSDLFEYDDIKVTKITPPLEIQRATAIDNQTIDITFNLDIDPSSIPTSNFTFENSDRIPDATTLPSSNVVRLSYNTPLPGNDYSLSVNNVKDTNDNTISENSTVSFALFDSFAQGDIIINEFLYTEPNGLPEYVEIKNTTDKRFNLSNWELADAVNSTVISNDTLILDDGKFLVISSDTVTLSNTFGDRNYAETGIPSLNNSGDAIKLLTSSGSLADSLSYTPGWGGDDVAIERRSASTSGIYKENWGNSPDPDGGTPGLPNEVAQDNSPPQLTDLQILSDQSLELAFDERLAPESASTTANYSFTGSGINSATFTSPDSVELSLDSELQNAQEYTLTISGAEDIFANAIPSFDTTFTYYKVSPVDSGDIAINEFMFAPPENSSEYIELHNHSTKSFDLNGWTLADNRSNPATITESQFIVPPDSFVVIAPDNTLLSTYPDIALVPMSDFPALNNGGDQIIIRNNSGILLDSLEYNSDWSDEEIALERRSITISGTYQNNWGTAPNGTGTPGSANTIESDINPPSLESYTIGGSKHITLIFSEQLDATTTENSANFALPNGPSISNANFSTPDTIALTLGDDLQNATNYSLKIQNIADIFGNAVSDMDTSFTFYRVSPVDSGDVFINEFNFQPSSGSTEYVEIYNSSDKSFDLQGWTLSDNRRTPSSISDSRFIIPPDSIAVIAPDNTLLSDFPDISLVTMNDFPSLNNGGDQIIIHDGSAALLDSLEYTSEWGGDQVALERRSVEAPATIRQNWGAAPNDFGTPGSANEIEPDNTPPFFTDLFAPDASTIQLIFSEAITPSTATNSDNYQIKPQRGIQLVLANKDSVTLSLDEPMTSGETYEVTVSDISDLLGNTLGGATKDFEYVKIDTAQPSDIVINEILHSPNDSQAEFIELYNSSDKNLDLNGWSIGDARNTTSIDQKVKLFPEEYLVITADNNFTGKIENAITVSGLPALNGDEDAVFIQNPNEITIDSLYYTSNWGSDEDGHSLERKDPLAASNDASNWQTSSSDAGYSAGSQNSGFQPDSTPPEVVFSKVLPDNNIEVRFSEFIRLTDEVRFLADGQPLNVISFNPDNANTIILESLSAKTKKAGTTITVENLVDVKGNSTTSTEVAVAQPMQQSDLVINEIMYNPLDEPDDNRADQSEYLELRNTQDYAISLEGLLLHDAPDEDGNLRRLQPVSTTAKWVPAQGHVLVYASQIASFNQSQIANFFEMEAPENRSLMRVDRSSLSLASSGDAIFIADSTGATIDSVFYGESWQNPNILDPTGVALERISPDGPSDDVSNWGSSVHKTGGTPNSENSIYQENPQTQQETGISFSPNPFSPDDDGHEDNLFINYKLDQQDYLIRVRIYDRYGRLVRELADGEQAGFEGQLIWDGRKDNGSRNRIGIYIVVFEAFDSAAGENHSFKETVVLARKLN